MNVIKKKILIIGNGEDFTREKIIAGIKESDFTIAADGGLKILHNLQLKPDLIIGDFDSTPAEILSLFQNIEIRSYPADKDDTDSQLAIKIALEMSPETVSLYAMTGSYTDHSLANIYNLFKYTGEKTKIELITANATLFPVTKQTKFINKKNRRISLFPLTDVSGLKFSNFKYHFNSETISFLDYSISNVIIEDIAEISITSGLLLCILFDKDYN